jgi:hypothetical protein
MKVNDDWVVDWSVDDPPRRPRRLLAVIAVLVVVGLLAVPVRVLWTVWSEISATCDWSDSTRSRLAEVPLEEFLGPAAMRGTPICSESVPDRLFVTAQLGEGVPMPGAWKDRQLVAGWELASTISGFSGPVLCYDSTDQRWRDVEVRLWSDGLVEASIVRGRVPCGG